MAQMRHICFILSCIVAPYGANATYVLLLIDVIRFRLSELMADYQFKTGKRLTAIDLSEATGINRMTLSRMQNVRGYSTSTDTVEKLCRFFRCDVGDLMSFVEDTVPDKIEPTSVDVPKGKTQPGRGSLKSR